MAPAAPRWQQRVAVAGGPRGRRALARCGLWLVLLGHAGLVLGAIVHGAVLRHVARPTRARSTQHEYTTANVVAVTSGLLVSPRAASCARPSLHKLPWGPSRGPGLAPASRGT